MRATARKKAARLRARQEPQAPNVFYARSGGHLVAVAVAGPGLIEVQSSKYGQWQRYRILATERGIRPWFIRLRAAETDRKIKLWLHLPGRRGRLDVGDSDSGGGLVRTSFLGDLAEDAGSGLVIYFIDLLILMFYLLFLVAATPWVLAEMKRRSAVAASFLRQLGR